MPGRHPPIADHFGNHLAPAGRFFVGRELERPDLARAMAFDATRLEDRRDIARVGDRAILFRFAGAADDAAQRFGLRHGHRLVGQQLVDRSPQVFAGGFVADDAHQVLVIDAALVAHHALAIEQKHLRRALGGELVGHFVAAVLQHRIRDVVLPDERRDLGERILRVRHDGDDRHAAVGIFVGNRLQPPGVQLGERALRSQKRDDDQIAVGEFGQRVILAEVIGQAKIGDRLSDGGTRLGGRRNQNGGNQNECGSSASKHGGVIDWCEN